jgi:hypothetical protein
MGKMSDNIWSNFAFYANSHADDSQCKDAIKIKEKEMKLKNVWAVVYRYPTNLEDQEDMVFFDNKKEAYAEFEKQFKDFKEECRDNDDEICLILRHNNKFVTGFRNVDNEAESMDAIG